MSRAWMDLRSGKYMLSLCFGSMLQDRSYRFDKGFQKYRACTYILCILCRLMIQHVYTLLHSGIREHSITCSAAVQDQRVSAKPGTVLP